MPAATARYDVLFGDGTGTAVGHTGRNAAVVDMAEERLPDDWGDPGRLLSAKLSAWRCAYARRIDYAPTRGRMALWVDGSPRRTKATRRYLRWAAPESDPPPHDDPDWIVPP